MNRFASTKSLLAIAALAGAFAWVGCEPPDDDGTFTQGDEGIDAQTEVGGDGTSGSTCSSNADCSSDTYCLKTACGDADGVCAARPEGCATVYLPVCGCDGSTYSNACGAAANGVNVGADGECGTTCEPIGCPPNSVPIDTNGDGCNDDCQEIGPGFCQSNADCDDAEFCAGSCGQPGTCTPRPEGCAGVYQPVCGCDGTTYGNACGANAAGVNVASQGECTVDCPPLACSGNEVSVDADGDGCVDTCIPENEACVPDVQFSDAPGVPFVEPSCGDGEFCLAVAGTCGASGELGVCVPKPNGCDDIYEPVCGCDGNTYGNGCEALAAGVQKLHNGECDNCGVVIDCQPGFEPVDNNGDGCVDSCAPIGAPCGGAEPFACDSDQFCETYVCGDTTAPGGDPSGVPVFIGEGVCVDIPQGCPEFYQPVCGCDGETYSNDCFRQAAAMSKQYDGECKQDCPPAPGCPPGETPVDFDGDGCFDGCSGPVAGCASNADCPDGSYCAQPGCTDFGECKPMPNACPDVWLPVCGCNGETYGNTCEAAAAGASVASEGECGGPPPDLCGGFAGIACSDGEYCEYPEGLCGIFDQFGTCTPMPQGCGDVWLPVCGCDGKTYGNDCERQSAGAQKAYAGECDNPCPVVIDCLPGYQPVDLDGDGCNDSCEPVSNACGGFVGTTCPSGQVCDSYPGTCGWDDAPGECVPAPIDCGFDPVYMPVCGCDGQTYSTDCFRLEAGVGLAYEGECDADCPAIACPAGWVPTDVDGDGCNDECVPDGGGGCNVTIVCQGGTVAIDTDGDGCKDQCLQGSPCISADGDVGCAADQFCEIDAGVCDVSTFTDGVCLPTPDACSLIDMPVCGCDGQTYPNDCFRQSAGVAKLANGACDSGTGTDPGTP